MQVGGQNGVRILLLANKLVFMSERACLEFASYLPLAEFRGMIEFDDEGLELTDDEGLELTVFSCMCKTSIIDSKTRFNVIPEAFVQIKYSIVSVKRHLVLSIPL